MSYQELLQIAKELGFECDNSYGDYYKLYKSVWRNDNITTVKIWAEQDYKRSKEFDRPIDYFLQCLAKYLHYE